MNTPSATFEEPPQLTTNSSHAQQDESVCEQNCLMQKRKVDGQLIQECIFQRLRNNAKLGKAAVRKILQHSDHKIFSELLQRSSDAACISPKDRLMIDHQINAEEHRRNHKKISGLVPEETAS